MQQLLLAISIILLLFVPMIAHSQNPPPPLTQGQPGEIDTKNKTKQKVNAKKNGTPSPDRMPIIANKPHSPHDEATRHHARTKEPKKEVKSLWDSTDILNILLVAFTGLLVLCNLLLWSSTNKSANAAKEAADAAKKSVDTIPTIERAYVYVSSITADFESWRNTEPNKISPITIEIRNYGKTPAKLTEIITNFQIRESCGSKIIWSPPDDDEIIDSVGRFIASNSKDVFSHYIHDAIGSGDYHINFFGEVRYIDIFGKNHIAYFNWTLVSRFKRGFYINNPEANYTT